ncbi:MAG: DNA polymerase III subunit delta [Candidatus Liberibacter europaeus]|uniref:DNA polymerase III subunit delta n=1 Tax=Candidatus Liberibacter europaeus TaxID=744859 RepID=A0A2T4VYZ7_9HYPH|nr:DNA polymerase III subunit delta [Candidatus Liberibacter europaeus]PTL87004.1 MAG: DNA polymerase III subunit delta [Candidatus Liberibacter europaeus]
MAEIKSYEFEKENIDKLLFNYCMFIFYGSDKGLVSELIAKLKKKIGSSYCDPISFVTLNSIDIQKNPEKIWHEINSISLFNKRKVIFIENLSPEKKVLDCLEAIIISKKINNILIIIKSAEIKGENRLRKMGKEHSPILCISCYPDKKINLINLMKEELLYDKKRLSIEAKHILLECLGGDRIASRNELQKLSSYCLEEDIINEEHVKDIISNTHILYIEEIIDTSMIGDVHKSILLVENFFSSKMSSHALLHGVLKRLQLLDKIHTEIEFSSTSIMDAVDKLEKTRILKKRLLLQKLIKIWNKNNVKKFLYKIDRGIQLIRKNNALDKIIVFQSILSITQIAHRK